MFSRAIPPQPKGAKPDSETFRIWFEQVRNAVPSVQTFSQQLIPVAVPDGGNEQSFFVKGLITTDIITINKPTYQAGLGIGNVRVSATNTLNVQYTNKTGSPITPATENYLICAVRL